MRVKFPQKKRFKTVYLVGTLKAAFVSTEHTHTPIPTHPSIARLVPSKIQLQSCLEILVRITTS